MRTSIKYFLSRYRKYHGTLLGSSLIEGVAFLLLFLTGLARYRFALVFVTRGILSAVVGYYLKKNPSSKIIKYWPILNQWLLFLAVYLLWMDYRKGQIYPQYPDLPIRVTLIIVGIGYGFMSLLYRRFRRDEMFTVCPRCGFANIRVVGICKNCGYEKGLPLEEYKENLQIPEELNGEIDQYKKAGLYQKPVVGIIKGIDMSDDETILITLRTYIDSIRKNGKRSILNRYNELCMLNRIVLTNKKICFLSERAGGWKHIECFSYDNIKEAYIETVKPILDPIFYSQDTYNLIIKTETNDYRFYRFNGFSIGYFAKKKLSKFEKVISCIKKRNPSV